MRKLIFALSLTFLVSGCSTQNNKLDKATALQILQENFNQKCIAEVDSYINSHYDKANFSSLENTFHKLEASGLVTLKKKINKHKNITTYKAKYTTEAVNKYVAKPGFSSFQVAVTELKPKEIVGISYQEDGNKALVIFKGDWEATPFFNIMRTIKSCSTLKDVQVRASLIRYDTGWRLQ